MRSITRTAMVAILAGLAALSPARAENPYVYVPTEQDHAEILARARAATPTTTRKDCLMPAWHRVGTEGLDELLTVVRLKLPLQLRRSLACTNIIENMMGSIRRVCRNVKHWRDAPMALRWTGAAMQEAAKGFRRLKAHKQLPVLREALAALQEQDASDVVLAPDAVAA